MGEVVELTQADARALIRMKKAEPAQEAKAADHGQKPAPAPASKTAAAPAKAEG